MKVCEMCGAQNDDVFTKCSVCGADLPSMNSQDGDDEKTVLIDPDQAPAQPSGLSLKTDTSTYGQADAGQTNPQPAAPQFGGMGQPQMNGMGQPQMNGMGQPQMNGMGQPGIIWTARIWWSDTSAAGKAKERSDHWYYCSSRCCIGSCICSDLQGRIRSKGRSIFPRSSCTAVYRGDE